jgi:hypothetical protein
MKRIRFTRFRGWLHDNSDWLALAVMVAVLAAYLRTLWEE